MSREEFDKALWAMPLPDRIGALVCSIVECNPDPLAVALRMVKLTGGNFARFLLAVFGVAIFS